MAKAADEISHYPEYQYIILNDDIERSTTAVRAILAAERLRRERQVGLPDFVKGLPEGSGDRPAGPAVPPPVSFRRSRSADRLQPRLALAELVVVLAADRLAHRGHLPAPP